MIIRIYPARHSGFISCVASSSRLIARHKSTTSSELSDKAAAMLQPSSPSTRKFGHGRTRGKMSAGHTFDTASQTRSEGSSAVDDRLTTLAPPAAPQPTSANFCPDSSTPHDALGSYRLFATRTQQRALAGVWKPPDARPILECLPPLPPIHDYDLALAATDFSTTPELSYKLALLGDAILSERAILGLDKAGMAKTVGDLAVSLHRFGADCRRSRPP